MKEVVLSVKRVPEVPVDASQISPDSLAQKSATAIKRIKIWNGNQEVNLSQIFDVEGDAKVPPNELTVKIVGNTTRIRKIGYEMKAGSIVIDGDTGMYLGEKIAGGSIVVNGNAGSWLGSRMKGGTIEVKGDAGDYVGSSYRGSTKGMKGGTIVVHGNAGNEIGCWMREGIIRIRGNTGMFPGMHMSGGTVAIEGSCEGRAGAQMAGGRVVVGGHVPAVLPSFTIEEVRPTVKIGEEKVAGPFYVFSGDINENGKGRLFINVNNNPNLKWCEKYL